MGSGAGGVHSIIPSRRNSITKKVRVGVKGLVNLEASHIELTISSSPSTSLKSIHMTATMTIFKGNTNNRINVWSEDRKEVPRQEVRIEVVTVSRITSLANIDRNRLGKSLLATEAPMVAVNQVLYTPTGTKNRINRITTVKNKISYSREVAASNNSNSSIYNSLTHPSWK